ncbi:MAG: diaminopimelate decarboxylase [Sulfolobales archaeon]
MIKIVGGSLYIGCFEAEDLAKRFGTPLYVYDEELIRDNYLGLLRAFRYKWLEILYSCKANSNPWILSILRDLGSGLDAVSPLEVLLGIKMGFPKEKILFTGVNVSDEEMLLVRGELGVMINIDSLSQLERYGRLFPETDISIRINPGFGGGHHRYTITGGLTKFCIYTSQIERAIEIARRYRLRIAGLHMHIGSGIYDVEPYLRGLEILLDLATRLGDVEFIDIGGGLGIPYRPGDKGVDIDLLGSRVSELLEEFSRKYWEVKLRIEPGRYIVGNAGILLTKVVDIKEIEYAGEKKLFIGVDTGMNHLIRPALYDAYHEIIPVRGVDRPREVIADVVGNICESGDILARDRPLPRIVEGEILAILDVGAYGYSMSSNYNLRLRPAEVLISGCSGRLIRRSETFEDLVRTAGFESLVGV